MFTWCRNRLGYLFILVLPLTVQAVPQRIVSLTPHITEMLFAIGAGSQVVAIDQASDYPADVKKLPKVANYQSLNSESLLAVKPDLVVAWGATQVLMQQQIKKLGIPLLLLQSQKLDDLPKELRLLGEQTGHTAQANQLATQIADKFADYRLRSQHRPKVTAFYQLWYPPLTTVANGSFIQEIMTMCGAENPFANSNTPYPQLSEEAVLAADPQIIFSTQHGSDLQHWSKWPQLAAVKQKHLYQLNADWLHRLSPRILLGIAQMCGQIDDVVKNRH
ncbi:cobalamin-binding protein [Tolumonas lignilytica]|jgi:ABC-type Fe3+-hydroxamate transport system, periplasmic component|uniref:cobalamin-binding protein n=1 Tax=Tolumonas lignilytica TaxID=1283284 RepID=UPI000463EE84|nr:cobalamin-binding protein [Tolumonas lignilytica]